MGVAGGGGGAKGAINNGYYGRTKTVQSTLPVTQVYRGLLDEFIPQSTISKLQPNPKFIPTKSII